MKEFVVILLLSIVSISCVNSKKYPTSLEVYGLKGAVSRVTEVTKSEFRGVIFKKIYFYNKKGYLYKVEAYNEYNKDEDTFELGETIFISDIENGKQAMFSIGSDSKDTVRRGVYNYVSDTLIKAKLIESSPKANVINITFLLDSKSRHKRIDTEVINKNTEVTEVKTPIEYIYKQNVLDKILQSNDVDEVSRDRDLSFVINEEIDTEGNPGVVKFTDKKGEVEYSLEKTYEYY